jgi:hypothetical protein
MHNDRGHRYDLVFSSATAVDTSSADVTLSIPSQLYLGTVVATTGTLKVDTIESTAVTFTGLPVGLFPVLVTKVYKTGTDATNIVALR